MPEESTPPTPCVTLYLATVKGARNLNVRGASNKPYEFRWSETHQKLVREYASLAQFTKEELDIRNLRNSPYVVCTLLGSLNPAAQARDGVSALIAASLSIPIPPRRAALMEVIRMAQAAVDAIDAPPTEEPPAAPPVPDAVAENSGAVEFKKPWKDEATGVPIDLPAAPVLANALTKPVAPSSHYTQAELMQGEIADVRAIAKGLGVSLHQPTGGAKSRPMLVADILAKQSNP